MLPPSSTVRLLDTATGEISFIPARELAPFMAEARVDGIDGTVWVDLRELRAGEYQHPPFEETRIARLRELKSALDEVYSLSLEQWEDGFRRDTDPDNEIDLWLHLARLYRRITTDRTLAPQESKDIFRILIACLNSPREHVMHIAETSTLNDGEIQDIIAAFYAD
jgi:hypothetical protein